MRVTTHVAYNWDGELVILEPIRPNVPVLVPRAGDDFTICHPGLSEIKLSVRRVEWRQVEKKPAPKGLGDNREGVLYAVLHLEKRN